MGNLDKLVEEMNNNLEEAKKKKKYPFSSMTITTGNPAHNINMFNKLHGTDGLPNGGWNTKDAEKAANKAAEDAAKEVGTISAASPDGSNSVSAEAASGDSASGAQAGGGDSGGGSGGGMGESLEDTTKKEEIPDTHEGQMEFLAADEDEAIAGYDEVIAKTTDETVKKNLKHIRGEEVAHKEYLDAAKEDPTVEYEHEEQEENLDESAALTEDRIYNTKIGGYVELPPQIKLIPQSEIEAAIQQFEPEEAFTVGYVTPVYFFKKLIDKVTLIKCSQMVGYTGVDYQDAVQKHAAITAWKNGTVAPNASAGIIKNATSSLTNKYADASRTISQADKTIYEIDPATGKVLRDANNKPIVKEVVRNLNTILFYPLPNSTPKTKYFLDLKDGNGFKEIAKGAISDTIYKRVLDLVCKDPTSGNIRHWDDLSENEQIFLNDVKTKVTTVLAGRPTSTLDDKPMVRMLYTNQIFYLAGDAKTSAGKAILLGQKLIENLTEAKRYVRRYYMRPQNIFCSNKAEILKALIDHADENCSIYTLNNLGDTKDVNKLTNDDIIYYYDDGILYDKNHVRIMDYDLAIKHEEDRQKINPETTSDKTFKDVYDDRMTELTDLEEEAFKQNFEDINAFGEKLTESKDDVFTCCICGEESTGYGNNPEPVKHEGRCCDACNAKFVIPARLEWAKKGTN